MSTTKAINVLSKMFENVFGSSSRSVCLIRESTNLRQILEESILWLDTPVISLTTHHLQKMNLTGRDVSLCGNSLVYVKECEAFLELLFQPDFNESISSLFSPWSRMILACEVPPKSTQSLLVRLVDEFFIDIYDLNFLHSQNSSSDLGSSFTENNFIVKHLYMNRTVLELNSGGSLKVRWERFKPTKWVPRFRSGKPFRISLFHCPPYWFIENGTEIKDGLESHLLRDVVTGWPVQYHIDAAGPSSNNWTHGVGLVEEKKRDLSLCAHMIRINVGRRVDYTESIGNERLSFLVRKPYNPYIYQPLEISVYAAVFGMLISTSCLLHYFRKISRGRPSDWISQYMVMLSILNQVAVKSSLILQRKSTRILVISWVIFSILNATYYSAGLTSTLAHPRFTRDISTSEDMIRHNVPWYDENGYIQRFFESDYSGGSDTWQKLGLLHRKELRLQDEYNQSAILVRILGNRYVIDIENLPPELWKYYKVLKTDVTRFYNCFILQKHSPYKRYFDETILRMKENGILMKGGEWLYQTNRKSMDVFFTNSVDNKVVNLKINEERDLHEP
ncbi:unnamed protein product [Phaedon cochleariae]|uniref:Ionotropic receptor n=1 Tax=Phaedon cochleariae TaxID=80249 RepID=A0A9N9X4K0_PHACE|nr:unnamed protein product [Phaedon cochleariae]